MGMANDFAVTNEGDGDLLANGDGDLLANGDAVALVSQVVPCEAQAATLLVAFLMSSRICAQGERIKFSPYRGSLEFELELDSSNTASIAVPFDRPGNRLSFGEVGNGKKARTIEVRVHKADVKMFGVFYYSEQWDFSSRTCFWDPSKEAPEAGFKEVIDIVLLILAETTLFHWIPSLTALHGPLEPFPDLNSPSNFPAIMEFSKSGIYVYWYEQQEAHIRCSWPRLDAPKTFHSWNSIPGEPFNDVLIDVLVSQGQVKFTNYTDFVPMVNVYDDVNDVNE
jgi:hypothetical protein